MSAGKPGSQSVVYTAIIAVLSVVIAVLVMLLVARSPAAGGRKPPEPYAGPVAQQPSTYRQAAASAQAGVVRGARTPVWEHPMPGGVVRPAAPAPRPVTAARPVALARPTSPSQLLYAAPTPRPGAAVIVPPQVTVPSTRPAPGPAAGIRGGLRPSAPQPSAPQPSRSPELDTYLQWIEQVENRRRQVLANIQQRAGMLNDAAALTLADPDVNDSRASAEYERRKRLEVSRTQQVLAAYAQSIKSNKPAVPDDCRMLDEAYLSGLAVEVQLHAEFAGSRPTARMQVLASEVHRYISDANRHLEDLYKGTGKHPKLVFAQ